MINRALSQKWSWSDCRAMLAKYDITMTHPSESMVRVRAVVCLLFNVGIGKDIECVWIINFIA